MKAIIQEEKTGCGIASVAALVNLPYSVVKQKANAMGIFADDEKLFSDTNYIRRLLSSYSINTSNVEIPFQSWQTLPDLALLSIKHYQENNDCFWHWVVFNRQDGQPVVLDSAPYLEKNVRTDFEAMQPEWFIEILNG